MCVCFFNYIRNSNQRPAEKKNTRESEYLNDTQCYNQSEIIIIVDWSEKVMYRCWTKKKIYFIWFVLLHYPFFLLLPNNESETSSKKKNRVITTTSNAKLIRSLANTWNYCLADKCLSIFCLLYSIQNIIIIFFSFIPFATRSETSPCFLNIFGLYVYHPNYST